MLGAARVNVKTVTFASAKPTLADAVGARVPNAASNNTVIVRITGTLCLKPFNSTEALLPHAINISGKSGKPKLPRENE
jgi:hypothetical protein